LAAAKGEEATIESSPTDRRMYNKAVLDLAIAWFSFEEAGCGLLFETLY